MDITKFLIEEEITIIEAMKLMDQGAKKILYVVRDGILVATLTDGDIRRWILRNGDLQADVTNAANYNPKSITLQDVHKAKEIMKTLVIESLPVLDSDGKIVDILFWMDDEREVIKNLNPLNIPVVMMAGGMGTRLYPYTNVLPKPLIPVGEIPIAEHIINQFYGFGCEEFHLIVNYKKNMIKAYFGETEHEYSIDYAEENEPLGTGGGLSLLKGRIKGDFILTNCDILIKEDFRKIYEHHLETGNFITMICSAKDFKIPYGVVNIDENGEISGFKEKPSLSFLTNTGCYIVSAEVIEDMQDNVRIGFPDVVERYMALGKKVGIYPIGEDAWLDMGQLDELERMRIKLENEI